MIFSKLKEFHIHYMYTYMFGTFALFKLKFYFFASRKHQGSSLVEASN